jgi:hypothetical protein
MNMIKPHGAPPAGSWFLIPFLNEIAQGLLSTTLNIA